MDQATINTRVSLNFLFIPISAMSCFDTPKQYTFYSFCGSVFLIENDIFMNNSYKSILIPENRIKDFHQVMHFAPSIKEFVR